jgi:Protein of unknown function (DUF3168)
LKPKPRSWPRSDARFLSSHQAFGADARLCLDCTAETAFPYIVYTPVATEQVIGINGLHGVMRLRMQVDVYAKTLQTANQLQDDVLGSVMAAIDTVSDVRMVNSNFDDEASVYRIAVDYTYHR